MKRVVVNEQLSDAILRRSCEVQSKLNDIVHNHICESRKSLYSQMNKQVYELAEKQGVSIWDVCFTYLPQIDYEHERLTDGSYRLRTIATIVPLEFHYPKKGKENESMGSKR